MYSRATPSVHPVRSSGLCVQLLLIWLGTLEYSGAAHFNLAGPPLDAQGMVQNVTAMCSSDSSCLPNDMNATTCFHQNVCTLTCPTRTDFPARENPLIQWARQGNGITGCQIDTSLPAGSVPPGFNRSNGFMEVRNTNHCSVLKNNITVSNHRLALSFWIKANCKNCPLVQLTLNNHVIIAVHMNQMTLSVNSCNMSIASAYWTHIVLQITSSNVSVVINGTRPIRHLCNLSPNASTSYGVQFGVNLGSGSSLQNDSYSMADVCFFSEILTDREIQQLYNGTFRPVELVSMSDCRCPYPYLTLVDNNTELCRDSHGSTKARLGVVFNQAKDLLKNKSWAGPSQGSVVFTVDLHNEYQVESVGVVFHSQLAIPVSTENLPVRENNTLSCNNGNCTYSLDLGTDPSRLQFSRHVVRSFRIHMALPNKIGKNIIVSSIAVTGRCNCNGNAAQCNHSSTSYQCECLSVTNTHGKHCENCAALKFHLSDQFDCQGQCSCNISGVNATCNKTNGQCACNEDNGQCPCKPNIQGQTCNECKDGYYNFTTECNSACGCSVIGVVPQMCHKTTGKCLCYRDQLNSSNKCDPVITSVSPSYGPLAGKTMVTITGLFGNSSYKPSVYLGSYQQFVLDYKESEIVFKTQNYTSTGSLPLSISWIGTSVNLISNQFQYLENPIVDTNATTSIVMFVSGGCEARIQGKFLNSVAAPKIIVTNGTNRQNLSGKCRHAQEDLLCRMPDLNGKNFVSSNLSFGLELDGISEYGYLGSVEINEDPKFDAMNVYRFQFPFHRTVRITGSNLDKGGCTKHEVSVTVGIFSCDVVSFSDSAIECRPPQKLHGSIKTIKVQIGNFIYQVGTLHYLEFWETEYFIGIMCGIAAFIILIIVLIIIFRFYRRRNMNSPEDSSQMNLAEKTDSEAPPNQYLPLPHANNAVSNGVDNPVHAEVVLRQPKPVLPPTVAEADLLTDFLNRTESSLWDDIRSSVLSTSELTLGRVCTNKDSKTLCKLRCPGRYARVIDGQYTTARAGQKTEKKVTIKTLKEPLPEQDLLPDWASGALRECLRLRQFKVTSVLTIMGLAVDKERFHIIYPYMKNRTLKDYIVDAKKEFSVRLLVEFGLQVAEAMVYLHSNSFVHKDIAARNCMVDESNVVKITDAAFSWDFYKEEYVYDSIRERYTPVRWMACESLTDGYYDMSTDVWSIGVLLWELLTRGCLPFHEVKDEQVKDFVSQGYTLGKPENCSDHLYEVMKECWKFDSDLRPKTSALVDMLGEELTGEAVEHNDIYVNMGTVEGYYENQAALRKTRRRAPHPPSQA